MKKFTLLTMIMFVFVLLSGCTKPVIPTEDHWKVNEQASKTDSSVKEQIAERNNVNQWEDENIGEIKKEANTELEEQDVDADTLASCLTEKGLKMYGTSRCSHCKSQKELFGNAFESIDYTDCDIDKQACLDAGIQWYPTWTTADGTTYPGEQSFERLSELAGC